MPSKRCSPRPLLNVKLLSSNSSSVFEERKAQAKASMGNRRSSSYPRNRSSRLGALLPEAEERIFTVKIQHLIPFAPAGSIWAEFRDEGLAKAFESPINSDGEALACGQVCGGGYNPNTDLIFMSGGNVAYRKVASETPGRKLWEETVTKERVDAWDNGNHLQKSQLRPQLLRRFYEESAVDGSINGTRMVVAEIGP
jgi:hypothetical protein